MGQNAFSSIIPALPDLEGCNEETSLVPLIEPEPATPPPCLAFQECETPLTRILRPVSPELPWMSREDTPPPLLVGLLPQSDLATMEPEETESVSLDQKPPGASVTPLHPQQRDLEFVPNVLSDYAPSNPILPNRTRVIHRGALSPAEGLDSCVCQWEKQNLLQSIARIIVLQPEVITAMAPASAKSFQLFDTT